MHEIWVGTGQLLADSFQIQRQTLSVSISSHHERPFSSPIPYGWVEFWISLHFCQCLWVTCSHNKPCTYLFISYPQLLILPIKLHFPGVVFQSCDSWHLTVYIMLIIMPSCLYSNGMDLIEHKKELKLCQIRIFCSLILHTNQITVKWLKFSLNFSEYSKTYGVCMDT